VKKRIHNSLTVQLTGIVGGVLHPASEVKALSQTVIPFLRRIYTEKMFFASLEEFTKGINYFQLRVRSKFSYINARRNYLHYYWENEWN